MVFNMIFKVYKATLTRTSIFCQSFDQTISTSSGFSRALNYSLNFRRPAVLAASRQSTSSMSPLAVGDLIQDSKELGPRQKSPRSSM